MLASRQAVEAGASPVGAASEAGGVDGTAAQTVRCQWCGAVNPAGRERCIQCDAAFPKPEQDAAILRASQERIRAAQEYTEMVHRKRGGWSLSRLFGGSRGSGRARNT
jgi:hypothetical protein